VKLLRRGNKATNTNSLPQQAGRTGNVQGGIVCCLTLKPSTATMIEGATPAAINFGSQHQA
jgi:hypothetical protein